MPAHFRAATPVLIVDAVEPTRTFFVDRLGFSVVHETTHAQRIGRCVVARGDVQFIIRSTAELRADFAESDVAGPYKAAIHIDVDDVGLLVPEVADADVVLAPRKTAAGTHEIGVREPGGNIILFASRVEEAR